MTSTDVRPARTASAAVGATAAWRWLAYALAGSAIALTLAGSLLVMSSRRAVPQDVSFAE